MGLVIDKGSLVTDQERECSEHALSRAWRKGEGKRVIELYKTSSFGHYSTALAYTRVGLFRQRHSIYGIGIGNLRDRAMLYYA